MLYRFYVGMIILKRRKEELRESETCKAREREPSRSSLISSMHFKPDDFVRGFLGRGGDFADSTA